MRTDGTEAVGVEGRVAAWVDEVEAAWASAGIIGKRRAALRAELASDLEQARHDGAPVEELLAEEPRAFAARVAAASQVERSALARRPLWRFSTLGLALGLVGGAVGGFAVALLTVYPLGNSVIDGGSFTYDQEGLIALVMHAGAAALSLAGALAVLAWAFPVRATGRRRLVGVGAGVLVGGLLSIWPTMSLAHALDYSFAVWVVLLEIAVVVGFSLVGALVAWTLLHRTPRAAASAA